MHTAEHSSGLTKPGHKALSHAPSSLSSSIALVAVDAHGTGQAAAHLLDDFAEALAVYARLGGDPAPQIVRDEPSSADTLVMGFAAEDADAAYQLVGSRAAKTRVYALVTTEEPSPAQAAATLEGLGRACADEGLAWEGGLAVGGAALRDAVRHTPRMGWLRRDLSEKVDQLILAVRCGTSAGVLESKPPLPRWAYAPAVAALARRAGRSAR